MYELNGSNEYVVQTDHHRIIHVQTCVIQI